MNNLEFRAWNKYHNKMYPVYALNFEVDLVYCKGDDYCSHTFGKIDCEVMVFTGITDRFGCKIFEDDVVEIAGYGNYHCVYPFIELYEAVMEDDVGKILGNIHQSPELLEK